jgi:signal peptidase I
MPLSSPPGRGARLALAAALAATAAAALKGRLTRFEVAESSMKPALLQGDYLIATVTTSVQRGDIVIYPDPTMPDRYLVKRAVGLPGENVSIAGGQAAIHGAVLAESWADGPTLPDGEWTIPAGSIFTLGDNRRFSSGDGRLSGPISLTGVRKAVWRYWPLGSFGRL